VIAWPAPHAREGAARARPRSRPLCPATGAARRTRTRPPSGAASACPLSGGQNRPTAHAFRPATGSARPRTPSNVARALAPSGAAPARSLSGDQHRLRTPSVRRPARFAHALLSGDQHRLCTPSVSQASNAQLALTPPGKRRSCS
jgi:hypothetical protein